MTFVPVPNGIQALLIWGSATLEWTNSLWFSASSFNVTALDALKTIISTAVSTYWPTYFADDYALKSIRFYDMSSQEGETYEPALTDVPGTSTGSLLPIQDALVVTLRSLNRGRSGRGRVYLSGLTESQLTEGNFIAGAGAAAVNMLTYIRNNCGSEGFYFCIASRYHNKAARNEGILQPVTAIEVRSLVPGNQQRRSRRP